MKERHVYIEKKNKILSFRIDSIAFHVYLCLKWYSKTTKDDNIIKQIYFTLYFFKLRCLKLKNLVTIAMIM